MRILSFNIQNLRLRMAAGQPRLDGARDRDEVGVLRGADPAERALVAVGAHRDQREVVVRDAGLGDQLAQRRQRQGRRVVRAVRHHEVRVGLHGRGAVAAVK